MWACGNAQVALVAIQGDDVRSVSPDDGATVAPEQAGQGLHGQGSGYGMSLIDAPDQYFTSYVGTFVRPGSGGGQTGGIDRSTVIGDGGTLMYFLVCDLRR